MIKKLTAVSMGALMALAVSGATATPAVAGENPRADRHHGRYHAGPRHHRRHVRKHRRHRHHAYHRKHRRHHYRHHRGYRHYDDDGDEVLTGLAIGLGILGVAAAAGAFDGDDDDYYRHRGAHHPGRYGPGSYGAGPQGCTTNYGEEYIEGRRATIAWEVCYDARGGAYMVDGSRRVVEYLD